MTSLFKAHGLGNDYLVWEGERGLVADQVVSLCDRHTGPGGDGVLEPFASDRADHGVTIWNPDGSIAEKSGNGLRIFAWWLVRQRGAPAQFTVDTGHDVVHCTVGPDQIAVQMGTARMGGEHLLDVEGTPLRGWIVDVGNPHFEVFLDPGGSCAWYKELEMNANNAVWNLMLDRPSRRGPARPSRS